MSQAAKSSSFDQDLNEYEHWISMGWGVNRYEDDDIFPIMSMRDDIHEQIQTNRENLTTEQIKRLKKLDKEWQDHISSHHDADFRFNFNNPEDKTRWWWWIDRLDELTEEQKSTT